MLLLILMLASASPTVDVTLLGSQAVRSDTYTRLTPQFHGGVSARATVGVQNPRVYTELGWRALDYEFPLDEGPERRSIQDLRWTVGGRYHLLGGEVGPSGPLVVPYCLFSGGLQVRYVVVEGARGGAPSFYSAGGAGVAVGGPVRLVIELQGEFFIGPYELGTARLGTRRIHYDTAGVGLLTSVGLQVSPRALRKEEGARRGQ